MSIGIKYCGGCNSRYDRTSFIKKLKDEYKCLVFENAVDNVNYDVVIVVCGCQSACASHDELVGLQKIIVTEENDYDRLKEILDEL
jgi:4-hydroxybutyrate CoA-transferase